MSAMCDDTRSSLMPAAILLALAAGAVVHGGCASNPATGGSDFVLMSEEKEIQIGRQTHPQVLQKYQVYPSASLQRYVEEIGRKLAAKSHRPNLHYTFTVLDSDEVNAFAVPGGYVYVTRGLMAYLNSEAELAAVLGHEIGHITARHAVRQQSQSSLLGILGSVVSNTSGAGAGTLTDLLGGAWISGYGRNLELEADSLGAEYLVQNGYSSEAIIDVVRILKNQELFEIERAKDENRKPNVYHGIFATHPDSDTRLREAVKSADRLETPESAPENRNEYLRMIDGMAFGKSKAGGVVREDEFRHSQYGIGLRFPNGWEINQGSGRLTATPKNGGAVLIMTRQPMLEPHSPLNILTDEIGLQDLQEGRSITPDGLDGYTAIAPRSKSPFGERPVRYAVVTHADKAFVFAGATNHANDRTSNDWKFLSTIKSLRLLDEKSRRTAKPPIIRVVEANQGTTVERLAAASPLHEYAEQQLRLLNDLYPAGEPPADGLIKIID